MKAIDTLDRGDIHDLLADAARACGDFHAGDDEPRIATAVLAIREVIGSGAS